MSNSNYKVRIKRRIFAIIAAVILAITCAMPALAGQENTGKGEFSFPMGNFISSPIALAQTPFSEAITYAQSTQIVAMEPGVMMPGKIAAEELEDIDPNGSHKMVKICAKWEYTYKKKDGNIVSGTTPEHCGDSYRAGHSDEEQNNAKRSREQACDAAEKDLPKLEQGDEWVNKNCKSYQHKG